jgi:hypothetical protein
MSNVYSVADAEYGERQRAEGRGQKGKKEGRGQRAEGRRERKKAEGRREKGEKEGRGQEGEGKGRLPGCFSRSIGLNSPGYSDKLSLSGICSPSKSPASNKCQT